MYSDTLNILVESGAKSLTQLLADEHIDLLDIVPLVIPQDIPVTPAPMQASLLPVAPVPPVAATLQNAPCSSGPLSRLTSPKHHLLSLSHQDLYWPLPWEAPRLIHFAPPPFALPLLPLIQLNLLKQ